MAQVKIYGIREQLDSIKQRLSDAVHSCATEALGLPAEKRFHRFLPLDRSDFMFPDDRTDRYTILEIHLFAGRSDSTKRRFIRLLYDRLERDLDIAPQDLEITLCESPPQNWGIRGQVGDELSLPYTVRI